VKSEARVDHTKVADAESDELTVKLNLREAISPTIKSVIHEDKVRSATDVALVGELGTVWSALCQGSTIRIGIPGCYGCQCAASGVWSTASLVALVYDHKTFLSGYVGRQRSQTAARRSATSLCRACARDDRSLEVFLAEFGAARCLALKTEATRNYSRS
jgi:hypothetical protein